MEIMTDQNSLFMYDALERLDSIRLLKVSVGNTDELCCDLIHTGLGDENLPNYSALSYVWGNPLMERPITCNGRKKLITATLESALRHVVRHNPHDYLWADQICINQLDSKERSQQVNIMGAIFQVSKFVIAFLGTGSEDTATACDLIRRISCLAERMDENAEVHDSDECEEREKLTEQRNISLAESEELGISYAFTDQWNALYTLFDNPWFERIWVVQEMLPCQVQAATDKIESRVVIGSHILWWDDIKYAATWIWYKGENRPQPANGAPTVDGLSLTRSMRLSWKSRFARGYCNGTRGKFDFRTLDLLNSFRDRDATDPRDKVYGLLGLSDLQELIGDFGCKAKVEVDYTKSVKEVYSDLAKAIIDDQKGLQVLLSAMPHSEEAGWPTWVPDWRYRDLTDVGTPFRHGKPDGGIPFRAKASPCPDVLKVEGKIVGTARFVHTERHCQDVIWHPDPRVLQQRIIDMMGETYHPTGQSVGTAFTLNLSAGWVCKSVQDAGTSTQEFADMVLDFIAALKLPRDTQELRDYRYSQLAKFNRFGFDESWLQYYLGLCERRIFVTDTDYIGLGNHHMEEGDVIAILFGLPVACVLRPAVGRAAGSFEFIGEAYVYGAMDGQVVKGCQDDTGSDLVNVDEFLLV